MIAQQQRQVVIQYILKICYEGGTNVSEVSSDGRVAELKIFRMKETLISLFIRCNALEGTFLKFLCIKLTQTVQICDIAVKMYIF